MKNIIKEWGGFTLFMTLLIVSRLFVWSNVKVDGHSMDPTLAHNDRLFVLSVTPIDRFDIVVAKNPDGDRIVKRVIGLPGDTLEYSNDSLKINGQTVDEPFLDAYEAAFKEDKLQKTYAYDAFFQSLAQQATAFTMDQNGQASFTLTVPEGQYYLLGDDRLVSKDSRQTGGFDQEDILGEVVFRFWPVTNLGNPN